MSTLRCRAGALALSVALTTTSVARAQPKADPVAAEALFQEAKALEAAGQLDEACAKFEASMAAEESPGTLLNLGRCHAAQGKLATAWAEYQRAAPMFRARGEGDREEVARKLAAELAPKLSHLTIVVEEPVPDLSILRNGDPIVASLLGTPIPVDPGRHRVEARAPGHHPFSADVVVGAAADRQSIRIPRLVVDPDAPRGDEGPEPTRGEGGMSAQAIAGLTIAGVGVAGVTVGAILGVTVLGDASTAEDDPALCPGQVCTPEGREYIDAAEGKALASNLLIGVGAAAVVGGLVLFLTAPSGVPEAEVGAVRVRLGPARSGAGASLYGDF